MGEGWLEHCSFTVRLFSQQTKHPWLDHKDSQIATFDATTADIFPSPKFFFFARTDTFVSQLWSCMSFNCLSFIKYFRGLFQYTHTWYEKGKTHYTPLDPNAVWGGTIQITLQITVNYIPNTLPKKVLGSIGIYISYNVYSVYIYNIQDSEAGEDNYNNYGLW